MIDTWMTRRTNYIKCEWFNQIEDEEYVNLNEIRHLPSPAVIFYAKEVSGYSVDNQQFENLWMADSKRVTLTTNDDVKGMKNNDLVKFDGKIWRVDSVQPTPKNTQRQYRNKQYVSNTTLIQLKG